MKRRRPALIDGIVHRVTEAATGPVDCPTCLRGGER